MVRLEDRKIIFERERRLKSKGKVRGRRDSGLWGEALPRQGRFRSPLGHSTISIMKLWFFLRHLCYQMGRL